MKYAFNYKISSKKIKTQKIIIKSLLIDNHNNNLSNTNIIHKQHAYQV